MKRCENKGKKKKNIPFPKDKYKWKFCKSFGNKKTLMIQGEKKHPGKIKKIRKKGNKKNKINKKYRNQK